LRPYYQTDNVTLYHGDTQEILPTIPGITAIISDPPYGCANNCRYGRFTGGLAPSTDFAQVLGDDQPFDPRPFLTFPKVVLFGFQFFADRLPVGTVLTWVKKRPNQLGHFLSDAELAWMKGGKGCYVFHHVWHGFDRESERGEKTLHPTQKPVAVMRWVMTKAKVDSTDVVCDPYLGSGATAVAALGLGCRFVGIELDEKYLEITAKRIDQHTHI